MKNKQLLLYRFHNPNTPKDTEAYLIKWIIEINKNKLEKMLLEVIQKNGECR